MCLVLGDMNTYVLSIKVPKKTPKISNFIKFLGRPTKKKSSVFKLTNKNYTGLACTAWCSYVRKHIRMAKSN